MKLLLEILESLQTTVKIRALELNAREYPILYPRKDDNETKIFNDIILLNKYLRHPQYYYLVKDKMKNNFDNY